jgi:hypothetical protein
MPSVGKSSIQHFSDTNVNLHDILVQKFFITAKEGAQRQVVTKEGIETIDVTLDVLAKLTSSIGYLQQTQATLNKNIYVEKDIKEFNDKLDRIPPEILESLSVSPELIVPSEDN